MACAYHFLQRGNAAGCGHCPKKLRRVKMLMMGLSPDGFECSLMKFFTSRDPYLKQNAEQDQGYTPPRQIVITSSRLCWTTRLSSSTSGSRSKNLWRLRQMKTPADKKNNDRDCEGNAQRRKPSLLDRRHHQQIVDLHGRRLTTRLIGCYSS